MTGATGRSRSSSRSSSRPSSARTTSASSLLALIYIAFVQLLLEGGIQTAIVQREDLDDEHLDSAFWVNLVWCVVLAGRQLPSRRLVGAVSTTCPSSKDVVKVLSILLVI